ncbi:MAG TPA: hypothetical protein VFJ27_08380, partial [Terriglobia bacterium]|nr:hypothetical protein [Terriglobia bacterium]
QRLDPDFSGLRSHQLVRRQAVSVPLTVASDEPRVEVATDRGSGFARNSCCRSLDAFLQKIVN